jgi:hypothetical protein
MAVRPTEEPGANGPGRESYAKVLLNLGGVLVALGGIAISVFNGRPTSSPPAPAPEAYRVPARPVAAAVATPPKPVKAPEPAPAPAAPDPEPEPPKLDRAAVARAEEELDAASRDRERAEARAAEAEKGLADAATQAAAEAKAARSLSSRVRDPSTRISQATSRGGFLRAERDKLKGEITALASIPKPKAKVLSNKNPVARPSAGEEYHFEVRRNRVSYIDLERLLAMVKADAQLRIRLADGARTVESRVGPVGAFALEYSLGRSFPSGLDELMERRGRISFDLRSWEIVPEFEGRGETYEATRRPISDFARAVNRLSPTRASITLWVYPDSFPLFRKLRDDLQSRGFLVAARPLPEGMAIRGSPSGSLSAGQ